MARAVSTQRHRRSACARSAGAAISSDLRRRPSPRAHATRWCWRRSRRPLLEVVMRDAERQPEPGRRPGSASTATRCGASCRTTN
ncbi:MAG: hypothetical protein MZW92_11415 [Comamonadaceae bacterium]|nr:hypothetical protein [Comamonadaceae bacterium]